jgi:uncharacterized membrane protein (UPF0127 family)
VRHADLVLSGRTYSVEIPETLAERRRGLLRRFALARDAGMMFERCRSVHTLGMRFPITVVVLDRDLHVLRVKTLPPNRLLRPARKARHILECAEGISPTVGDRAQLRLVGDELEEEEAHESSDDDTDGSRGDDHERHDPADGARKRDGLATSFGGPEAEDLEH